MSAKLSDSNAPARKPRRPVVALALSGLFPGLGQLYNGERRKAALFFIAAVLTAFGPLHPIHGDIDLADPVAALTSVLVDSLPFLAIAVWSLVDAYRSARRSPG